MPTQTFFNLPKEKQDKIIIASKEEFSDYSFYDASINRIVKNAGISRGSFYLYFKNKEDIFIYLLDKYKTQLSEVIKENMNEERIDLFEVVILVFDYLTSEELNKDDRDLIIKTFSIMDAKLSQHLLNFEQMNIMTKDMDCIQKNIRVDNLKISKEEDLFLMMEILRSIFVSDIGMVFEGKIEKDEAREKLMKKMSFLKYGVEMQGDTIHEEN